MEFDLIYEELRSRFLMLQNKSETTERNKMFPFIREVASLPSDGMDQSLLTQHSIIEFFLNGGELSMHSMISVNSRNLVNH